MRVTTLEHVHHDGVVVETRPRVAADIRAHRQWSARFCGERRSTNRLEHT
jgi:hypothetical protein